MIVKPSLTVHVRCEPVAWYVEKLEKEESFTSLLYGDGEFMVADGEHIGQTLAFSEVVTEQLYNEMVASLLDPGTDIIRGTDPNLVNHESYGGSDLDSFRKVGQRIDKLLTKLNLSIPWFDGVMWDRASREGELGPLIRALWRRQTVIVGNARLRPFAEEYLGWLLAIPSENAVSCLDQLEGALTEWADRADHPVFVLCMGLGAIPLAMRLRRAVLGCTVLDLGSNFDVFAGIGEQRGWRAEMYANKQLWQETLAKHLSE